MVRTEGLEPSRGYPQGILSPLRLPFRHVRARFPSTGDPRPEATLPFLQAPLIVAADDIECPVQAVFDSPQWLRTAVAAAAKGLRRIRSITPGRSRFLVKSARRP
jgi:hypothetical protein